MNSSNNSSHEFVAFLRDGKERLLPRDGHEITLTPKAFETLLLLVEKQRSRVDERGVAEQIDL